MKTELDLEFERKFEEFEEFARKFKRRQKQWQILFKFQNLQLLFMVNASILSFIQIFIKPLPIMRLIILSLCVVIGFLYMPINLMQRKLMPDDKRMNTLLLILGLLIWCAVFCLNFI